MNRLIATLALALATAAHADTVAITAARMVDVATGRYVQSPVVVVTDGRVVAAGAGARRIDLGGLTIIPGLIDMHVHPTGVAEIGGYRGLQYTAFWTAGGVANAKKTLEAGFTTVRNVGSADFADVGLRPAIDEDFVPGPRIVSAGRGIGATGGHCDETGFPPSMDRVSSSAIIGVEAARRKVRWLRKYGAQVVKIRATGGVRMAFGSDGGVYPHGDDAKQFAKTVEWGMTPAQAIRPATLDAADALGRAAEVGSLTPGHWGDTVAVDGDPLRDVIVLERPAVVIEGGTIVKDAR